MQSQMNGCNLYQRLNVNHRSNRRGTILLYSPVLYSLSPSPQIAKDGTMSGPGPEPPPMGISTRPVVHKCGKTARCSRSWHAQPRIRPRGASGRPRARKCRSLSDLLSGTVSPDISGRRSRRNKRKGKKRKAEKKVAAPDNHMLWCEAQTTQIKKKGLFRKLDLSRM